MDETALGKVYKKDAEGATYGINQCVYQGKIISSPRIFGDMTYVLNNIGNLEPRDTDVWLLSFPKSGTHWVYEILSILSMGELRAAKTLPDDVFLDWRKSFERTETTAFPTVFTDYLPKYIFKKQRVVYLLRNPKSVAASLYSNIVRGAVEEYNGKFTGHLPVFLKESYDCCGTWFDHVKGFWKAHKNNPNVLFVTFEDLKQDPVKVIREISTFLGYTHGEEFIKGVVSLTSLESMKIFEQQRAAQTTRVLFKDGKVGIVQEGRIDGWKDKFSVEQNEYFNAVYSKEMEAVPDLKEVIKFE